MAKHKKNKKKKNRTMIKIPLTSQIVGQEIQDELKREIANSVEESEPKDTSYLYFRRELIKIGLIFVILLILLIAAVVIKSSTPWFNLVSDQIYSWLKLGA